MKKYISILIILGAVFCLTGCNTVEGFGEDLEETGDAIESSTY